MATRIVGIGASAGGLEALEDFLKDLPGEIDAALVIVQHLSPNHESSMEEILQRATDMPVHSLNEDVELVSGAVYVKSPNRDVRVDGSGLRIIDRPTDQGHLYLPIDEFFFSLAAARGSEAIAIILSGMGTDGSRGVKDIKEAGGIVMVQAAASARFDGMPQATIRQRVTDIIGTPAELAERLALILQSEGLFPEEAVDLATLTEGEVVTQLLEYIRKTQRIDFTEYRRATILRRVEKRMLINQISELTDYVGFVMDNEAELQILRHSFLIGVTRFFRDREAFDIFQSQILPQLFSADEPHREVRLWVPSCSTGEEVYSYAILLAEYLRENRLTNRFKIFGSDVDRHSITLASAGEYDATIAADVPRELLRRYFTPHPTGYSVTTEIKERILFAVQNLLIDPPFIRIDFLACRNFLIYISTQAQRGVIANFHFALQPDGFLFLGPSENLGELTNYFKYVHRRWKFFQKRPADKRIINHRLGRLSPASKRTGIIDVGDVVLPPSTGKNSASPQRQTSDGNQGMDYFSRYLADRYAPPTLFIDQNYTVIYLSGDFSDLLRLPRYNALMSLRTLVEEEVQDLLVSGVDRVLETGNSASLDRVNFKRRSGDPLPLRVRFSSVRIEAHEGPVAQLEFLPLPDQQRSEPDDEALEHFVEVRFREQIKQLEDQLHRSEQRAQKLYNELEATNEELQSSNRELLASNEEMQSTNEELQSVNEELYTVNAEFQRKNDELNNINNDVNNLLKSTQISTIFVDSDLSIRRFTPGVSQLFDLYNSDLGRPITAFATPFAGLNMAEICQEVLENNTRHDEEIHDRNGNHFLLRVLPYLTEEEMVEGVVITFVDIRDLIETRHQLTDLAHKYRAIFDYADEVIAIIRENSRILEINQSLVGVPEDSVIDTYLADYITSDEDKVRFSEALRSIFDAGSVQSLAITLGGENGETVYAQLEVIPIQQFDGESEGSVEQAMVILHDITELTEQRRAADAIIAQYQMILANNSTGGGLIDMSGNLATLNDVGIFEDRTSEYLSKNLRAFLSPAAMNRYRLALQKIRSGAESATVFYPASELINDESDRTVCYRPVYDGDRLLFLSFELVDEGAEASDTP